MYSQLYTRVNYLNKAIDFLSGVSIIEYDIKSAGFNVIKRFKLLNDNRINFLEGLEKKERQREIGLIEKHDKELYKKVKAGMAEMRRLFFEKNSIQDEDILSIKNDAIYIIDKVCEHTVFDNIEFRPKGQYTSYFYLNKFEFYINKNNVDVKGINDANLVKHKDYMLDLILTISNMLEQNNDRLNIIKYLNKVAEYYRNRELDAGYYRELNQASLFRPKSDLFYGKLGLGYDEYEEDLNKIDITFNYRYIVNLYRLLL